MNKFFACLIIAYCCVGSTNHLHAQQKPADTLQTATIEASFKKSIGSSSRLYNGFAYNLYTFNSPGNAYFNDTTKLIAGNVKYDGIVYKNIPLLYDTYADLLISVLQNSRLLYSLITEKVDYFDVMGHHFIYMQPIVSGKPVTAGFYDELYANKLQLLARRTKTTQQSISFNVALIFFLPHVEYYLKKDGIYYNVNSRGKFLDLFKDKKEELKKQLKTANISYGDNPEQAMILLCNYYDSLTK